MSFCPSCQAKVSVSQNRCCPSCGYQFNRGGAGSRSIIKSAVRPKIPVQVDLAITVDRTGSSLRFQDGIHAVVAFVLQLLSIKVCNVVGFLQSHGDLDEGQDTIMHTDSGTAEQVMEDLKQIQFGGGGEPPEHHLDAIEKLLSTIPWKSDPSRARGAILALMTADTKPSKSGISARELGEEIKRRGLLLFLVCEPTPTLVELVKAAGGMIFEITNNPDEDELKVITHQLGASIVASVGSGGTIPMTVPAKE